MISVIVVSCGSSTEGTKETIKESISPIVTMSSNQAKIAGITCCNIDEKPFAGSFQARGNVVVLSQNQATVSPKINGTVERIFVLEGQYVQKGQLIAVLSSLEFVELQQRFLESKQEWQLYQSEAKRMDEMYAQKAASQKEWQQAKTKAENALVQANASEARLKLLGCNTETLAKTHSIQSGFELRSPIAGYLYKLPISIGSSMNANSEAAHILNLERLHADIFVFEKDIIHVHEGQKVRLHFVQSEIPEAIGEVEFISRSVDPEKKSVLVHVVFKPGHPMILPEMQVEASFTGTAMKQAIVPSSAILREANTGYIFTAQTIAGDSLSFQKVPIQILGQNGDEIAIESNKTILPGNKIACKGVLLLESELSSGDE